MNSNESSALWIALSDRGKQSLLRIDDELCACFKSNNGYMHCISCLLTQCIVKRERRDMITAGLLESVRISGVQILLHLLGTARLDNGSTWVQTVTVLFNFCTVLLRFYPSCSSSYGIGQHSIGQDGTSTSDCHNNTTSTLCWLLSRACVGPRIYSYHLPVLS